MVITSIDFDFRDTLQYRCSNMTELYHSKDALSHRGQIEFTNVYKPVCDSKRRTMQA